MIGPAYAQWVLFVPTQAVGASTVYWDLFNNSDRDITVSSVCAIKDGETAVTGTLSVEMWLTRTTAVGTGGTTAALPTAASTSLTAAAFTNLQQRELPSGITGRLTPTGGATAGAVISTRHLFSEETNAANYEPLEFLRTPILVPEGTGIRVVQGSTASVGNIAFDVWFY